MVISFESESMSKNNRVDWKSKVSWKLDGYSLHLGPQGLQLGSQGGPKIALEAFPERFKKGSGIDDGKRSVFEGCP